MKKFILLFAIMLLPVVSINAQKKVVRKSNNTSVKKSTTKAIAPKTVEESLLRTEEDIVKEAAEKWFKEVYVEKMFKDPYSYRLMGIKIRPVTYKEGMLELRKEAQAKLDAANKEYKDAYYEFKRFNSSSQYELDKAYAKAKKIMELNDKMAKMQEEQIKKIDSDIYNASEKELDTKIHYQINLDCYSKNSLGNEVLGRYTFPFAVDGPVGGIDRVKNLNE